MSGRAPADASMRTLRFIPSLLAIVSAGSAAPQLQPVTAQAWEKYIRVVDERAKARVHGGVPFLWTDEKPDRRLRLQRGEVLVAPIVGRGIQVVPDGLIHDWIAAVYLPDTNLQRLTQFLGNYNQYPDYFKPFVVNSRVLSCSATDAEVAMTWQHSVLFVKAAIQARFHTHYFMVDQQRGYSIGGSAEVFEIADLGSSTERMIAPDRGHGYVWRLHSITRYQQRENGVYLEIEALALTRSIPSSIHWLIAPVVARLSVNSLTTMLRQTREGLSHFSDPPLPVCVPGGFGIAKAR